MTVSIPRVSILMIGVRSKKLRNLFTGFDAIMFGEGGGGGTNKEKKYRKCVGKIENLISNR